MEDLTGNIIRVVDGLADEVRRRIEMGCTRRPDCPMFYQDDVIRNHVRQVLIDWFLGEFIPGQKP